jgi:hypothetical protein
MISKLKMFAMKTFAISFLTLLLFIAILPSCQKSNEGEEQLVQQTPPITLDSMIKCNSRVARDSAAIHGALIGKWKWEFISCFWNPEKANGDDFKTLAVEFKSNDTVEVKVDNAITQKSSWKVKALSDGSFSVVTTPIVLQLPGRIMFCGDRVLFQDSYVDGCDNYFIKQR